MTFGFALFGICVVGVDGGAIVCCCFVFVFFGGGGGRVRFRLSPKTIPALKTFHSQKILTFFVILHV